MLRKLYHIGIDDNHWTINNRMHTNAKTSIKWKGYISESFNIEQGVRQGDISSADLYKIYVDPLLHRLNNSGLGVKIGDVECCATACADDITINSNNEVEAQILVNMATDYSSKEQYKIQPEKSVVIDMGSTKTKGERSTNFKIHDKELPIVNTTTHLLT